MVEGCTLYIEMVDLALVSVVSGSQQVINRGVFDLLDECYPVTTKIKAILPISRNKSNTPLNHEMNVIL
jgi:hypothetical protein